MATIGWRSKPRSSILRRMFCVATVTDLLEQNVELESAQDLAGHADPRTTRLYDRRRRKVTRNIVERISLKGLSRQD